MPFRRNESFASLPERDTEAEPPGCSRNRHRSTTDSSAEGLASVSSLLKDVVSSPAPTLAPTLALAPTVFKHSPGGHGHGHGHGQSTSTRRRAVVGTHRGAAADAARTTTTFRNNNSSTMMMPLCSVPLPTTISSKDQDSPMTLGECLLLVDDDDDDDYDDDFGVILCGVGDGACGGGGRDIVDGGVDDDTAHAQQQAALQKNKTRRRRIKKKKEMIRKHKQNLLVVSAKASDKASDPAAQTAAGVDEIGFVRKSIAMSKYNSFDWTKTKNKDNGGGMVVFFPLSPPTPPPPLATIDVMIEQQGENIPTADDAVEEDEQRSIVLDTLKFNSTKGLMMVQQQQEPKCPPSTTVLRDDSYGSSPPNKNKNHHHHHHHRNRYQGTLVVVVDNNEQDDLYNHRNGNCVGEDPAAGATAAASDGDVGDVVVETLHFSKSKGLSSSSSSSASTRSESTSSSSKSSRSTQNPKKSLSSMVVNGVTKDKQGPSPSQGTTATTENVSRTMFKVMMTKFRSVKKVEANNNDNGNVCDKQPSDSRQVPTKTKTKTQSSTQTIMFWRSSKNNNNNNKSNNKKTNKSLSKKKTKVFVVKGKNKTTKNIAPVNSTTTSSGDGGMTNEQIRLRNERRLKMFEEQLERQYASATTA